MVWILSSYNIVIDRGKFTTKNNNYDLNLFPKKQILDSSKLKGFAGNNFEYDENGGKFS